MGISSPGIGSNLDVNSIVTQLMQAESQPLVQMQQKEASYQTKLSAYGQIQSAFSTFQSSLSSLTTVAQFQAATANVSDSTVLSASATSIATPGSYSLSVSQLAQAQKLASAGQASDTAAIGAGTLTFDFGTIANGTIDTSGKYTGATFTSSGAGTKTVTISPTNNSLSGIRDAINAASIGVTASIVNDGSASPYRLVLTDSATGAANSMKISVAGDAGLSNLLSQDPAGTTAQQAMSETITAQDAKMTVDGLAVTKPSNTVSDVISGVTLNLTKTNAGTPTTLTVARDSGSVTQAVTKFVNAYNTINTALTSATAYDTSTKTAGPLNGDTLVMNAQAKLRSLLSNPVAGASSTYNTLSSIGVSFQKDGTLAVDSTKLNKALTSNFNDVAAIFAAAGKATDSLVSYTGSSAATKAGSYALNVTQMATQAATTGASAAGLQITAGQNDGLTVNLDGLSGEVLLDAGTYASADALAAAVQSKINGNPAFGGASVKVTQTNGVLTLTSASYGSYSGISIGGNGAANLFGGTPTLVNGTDVAGTLNGVAATGHGQILTGATGDASAGLQVVVSGGVPGDRGTVNYSRGYATQLNDFVNAFIGSDGILASGTDGMNRSIKDLQNQEAAEQVTLNNKQTALRAQFTALDTMMGQLTATSSYLTQQLSMIAAQTPA